MGWLKSSLIIQWTIFMAALLVVGGTACGPAKADTGYPAPNWEVKKWVNTEPLFLPRMRGKVVVLEFFQMDCRPCDIFTIPVLKRWYRLFSDEVKQRKLLFVSIHSVPELALYQSEPRLRAFIKARGIRRAVGIDRSKYGQDFPITMQRYKVQEFPVMVFIDKRGDIRYRKTGRFSSLEAEVYLRQLLAE